MTDKYLFLPLRKQLVHFISQGSRAGFSRKSLAKRAPVDTKFSGGFRYTRFITRIQKRDRFIDRCHGCGDIACESGGVDRYESVHGAGKPSTDPAGRKLRRKPKILTLDVRSMLQVACSDRSST